MYTLKTIIILTKWTSVTEMVAIPGKYCHIFMHGKTPMNRLLRLISTRVCDGVDADVLFIGPRFVM